MEQTNESSIPEIVVDVPPGEMDPGSGNSNYESTEVPIIQWLPSLHLLTDRNLEKEKLRLDLLNAALEGNIDAVNSQLFNPLLSDSSSSSLSASSSSSSASTPSPFNVAITEKHETIFHVAAGANQTDFIEKMIDKIAPDDLKLQNVKGNTAFCLAVMAGNKSIAEKMLNNDPDLLTIRGGGNLTPLNLAAMFGERQMALYLYRQYDRGTLTLADKKQLFFDSIDTSLYDLARKLLEGEDANQNELAMTEYEHGMDRLTPLHRLALTPFHLLDQNNRSKGSVKCLWEKILKITGQTSESDQTSLLNQALALVKCLWEKIFMAKHDQVWDYLKEHRDLLFKAAQLGNFKFLGKLIELYPDLVHLKDDDEQTIFHIAIMYRHDDLFKLIDQIGFNKQLVASYSDSNENSLLHLAAKYPDPRPLSTVPGAALEMQRELRIFKDVEKLVMPSFRGLKNSEGKTPRELFTTTHAGLQKDGEKWMRNTASQCMLVATIIATVVFQAAFTVPGGVNDAGGNNNLEGTPTHRGNVVFRIFVMTDIIALSSSSISILMFLSILTSRYAQDNFFRSLPVKLVIGLLTLFVSIATMMLAFISSFYLAYNHYKSMSIPILGTIFVFLPLLVFGMSQYGLLREILSSSFHFRFFPSHYNVRKQK
ncbi:ankyrin repeat-containing protein At5g02620-like [Pistacia vera]|nr:ankyrin repeat-containing protein At5g02620-like [Pistacia vera]